MSFSKVTDDLGQWRSYADDGKGFALAFDGVLLENLFINQTPESRNHNSTYSIRYNDIEIRKLHEDLIKAMFHLISFPDQNRLSNDQLNIYLRALSRELSSRLIHTSLFFKHQAYRHEDEFRYLQIYRGDVPAPDVKYRPRNYQMIKYREFDWSTVKALKKIIIGPAADFQKAKEFAKYSLDKAGLSSVQIEFSSIPYRSI